MSNEYIVVTKFKLVGKLLKEMGFIPPNTPVKRFVEEEEIAGSHVFGRVPVHMMHLPEKISIPQFKVPRDVRVETVDDLRKYFKSMLTYEVEAVDYQEMEEMEA